MAKNSLEKGLLTIMAAFDDLCKKEQNLHRRKKHDYTGGAPDIIANYRRAAEILSLSSGKLLGPEHIILSRIEEKVYRLANLLSAKDRQVQDESEEDTCLDISILAKLFVLARTERHM